MTKTELVAALCQSTIWKEDRYGHFHRTFKGARYRLKIQVLSVRYEKKIGTEWFNKAIDYYKNVDLKDGNLSIQCYMIPLKVMPQ